MNGTMVHSLVPPLPTWQMLKAYDSVRTWPFLGMLMGSSTGFIADFSDESTDDVSLMRKKKIVGYKRPSVKRATFFFFLPLNQYLFIACNAAARTRRVTSRTRRRVNQTPLRPFTTLVLRYF